jgi:hypothetical protein
MMSGEGGSRLPDHRSVMSHDNRPGLHDRGDSVLPNESASHHGGDSPSQSGVGGPHTPIEDLPFSFKFKAPSGRVHRLQVVASAGIEELISSVASKLGSEVETIGGTPTFEYGKISRSGFALSYLDNEGDTVSITTHDDLVEAISLSRQAHREKVNPQPGLAKPVTPPESVLRDRKKYFEEEEEEEEVRPKSKSRNQQPVPFGQQPEIIQGVPNDLLLPGAIGILAVVIVGVFVLGRSTSR